MGSAASISNAEDLAKIKSKPQWTILVENDKKLKEEDKIIPKIETNPADWQKYDPYLKYGGAYLGDEKDSIDFNYLTFTELPKVINR